MVLIALGSGVMTTRYKKEMAARGLEKPRVDFKKSTAEEWSIYWRGTIILSLLIGALLLVNDPGRNPANAFFALSLIFILMYPFYLVAKLLLLGAPGFFILALILFTGTPLLALVWGWICMLIFRYVLFVRKAWTVELIVSAIVFTAAAVTGRQVETEVKTPVPDATETAAVEVTTPSTPPAPIAAETEIEAPAPSPPPEPAKPTLKEFRDFSGYYTVQLPEGFTIINKTVGPNSKNGFEYGPNLNVWILAHEMRKTWNPETEMMEKAAAIRNGRGPFPGPMSVDQPQLVSLGGGDGYELKISGTYRARPAHAHTFALVGQGLAASIAVTCSDEKELALYDTIIESIRETFRLADRSSAIVSRGAGSAVIQASRATGPHGGPSGEGRDRWDEARKSINIMGVMKQGDRQVALINGNIYGVGDKIPVNVSGQIYSFTVQSIGANSDQVVLEPLPNP